MTLEEALATPGTLVATWHEVADDEELARVQVFSVGAAGATRVAEVEVKRRLRHTTFNTVYERGARLGCNQVAAPYVWVADEQGLLLWSATALIVKADRAVLEVRGKPVGVTQIAKVSSLGDARPSVRLELTSGESIALAEASDGSGGDAAWAHELGRDVANWLELPHDDHITETSNADELRVAALMHRFSDRIESMPSSGTFEPVIEELGPIGDVPVELSYVPNPFDTGKRFVELRALTASRKSSSAYALTHGTSRQIGTYLYNVRIGSEVIALVGELARGLTVEGYQ